MDSVLIIDDHPIVRRGIRGMLEEIAGLRVVAEASSASEARELVREHQPTMATLDISLPDQSGVSLLKPLLAAQPGLKILVLSMHPEEQYARQAYLNGAWGYLTKNNLADELRHAVIRVMEGHKYVSEHYADLLVDTLGRETAESASPVLSERELQVLVPLASGQSLTEIAAALHLSVQTVSTYRRRLLDKLQLQSNADLVRYALEQRLIE